MVNLNFAAESKDIRATLTYKNSPNRDNSTFARRHIGPNEEQIEQMLQVLGVDSLDELIDRTIPAAIRLNKPLNLPEALSESAALAKLKAIAASNQVYRSFIGQGYYNCITPAVILRNVLENPG